MGYRHSALSALLSYILIISDKQNELKILLSLNVFTINFIYLKT